MERERAVVFQTRDVGGGAFMWGLVFVTGCFGCYVGEIKDFSRKLSGFQNSF